MAIHGLVKFFFLFYFIKFYGQLPFQSRVVECVSSSLSFLVFMCLCEWPGSLESGAMPGGMREAAIRKTVKERLVEEYWKVPCIMNIRLVRRWYSLTVFHFANC